MNDTNLKELLDYIDPAACSYQEWVNVGMALKHEGFDCSVWDEWSQADGRYKTGDCEKKWKTFNEGSGSIVTGGTIVELAKQYGWMPQTREIKTFDFDDYIEYDGDPDVVIKDTAWIDSSNIVVIPSDKDFDGVDELRRYLQALFKPDDIIGYCVDATQDEKGKWRPSSKGVADRTVKELLTAIKKHPKDIADTIGDYQKAAGAWIRFNPLDGQGVGNVNVTDYRYALVESDSCEIEKQKALMEELKLRHLRCFYFGCWQFLGFAGLRCLRHLSEVLTNLLYSQSCCGYSIVIHSPFQYQLSNGVCIFVRGQLFAVAHQIWQFYLAIHCYPSCALVPYIL